MSEDHPEILEVKMEQPGHPIFPPYREFYIQSMLFNARSAIRSIDKIYSIIDNIEKSGLDVTQNKIDIHDALDQLQNIVVQGASLSRYFWPVRKGHEKRAEELREKFSITEQSPLFLRTLRNEIEHFDEKLDKYLAKGAWGIFLPEYFDYKPEPDGPTFHLFRAYYIDTGEFHLLGNEYDIQPIADEIHRLYEIMERGKIK